MKITISGGSSVEDDGGTVKLEAAVISLWNKTYKSPLVFAYCLRPGEQIRKVSEGEYEVIF